MRRSLYSSTILSPILFGVALFVATDSAKAAESGWPGCYAGAQVGGAHSTADWTYKNLNPYNSPDPAGPLTVPGTNFQQTNGLIGAQVGCNYSLSGPWMFGLEGAWMGKAMTRAKDNGQPVNPGFTSRITTDINSILSLTARLGYNLTPDWLFYVKGGYAGADIETSGNVSPTFTTANFDWNDSRWHHGWTVGAGVEYRLMRNVTIGAEYGYYSFGNEDHFGAVSGGTITAANQVEPRVSADVHTVMARINFGFGGGDSSTFAPDESRFGGTFSSFINSEVKYSSWHGGRGSNIFSSEPGKGMQVYSPTTIGIDYSLPSAVKVETRVKGGTVYSNHGTQNQGATYEGPVDTQVSINATFLNFESIRPTLGVAVNLPTGTSYLPGHQRFSRMDSDLVDIGSYGAGFNVNPTAGFIIGLNQSTAMSFSAGYAWQGEFVREGVDLSAGNGLGTFDLKRRINPGDAFTANANITTSIGKLSLLGSFAYMSETEVTVDGVVSGRSGDRYTTNISAGYQFDERWALQFNGSWSYSEKNEISNLLGGLMFEPKNSNSNVLIGSIEPTYQLTERLRLGVNYSVLYRDENYYDQIEDSYSPAKTKQTVGVSANYAFSPTASIELRGGHSWIEQDTGALLVTNINPTVTANLPPSLSYQAWMASVSANFRF